MNSFSQLGIGDDIVAKLESMSITEPTAIQQQSLPLLLNQSTDLIALSQTGSGKTLAFGLPLIEQTDVNSKTTQHLVVAPTRELAIQVSEELENVGSARGRLYTKAIFGGTPVDPQVRSLKKSVPHILVATPGRLIDMLERGAVKLDNLKNIVLDEADEMLNMGFKEDIYRILEFTASDRSLWMFSATMAKEIRKITKEFMTDPEQISINASEIVNRNIEHKYTVVKRNQKAKALERFFDFYPEMYGIVFCRTRLGTQSLSDELNARGYSTEALHGDMSQAMREKVMNRFRKKQVRVLCATDVAARGIDVDDLTHVFHHSLPDDDAFYTHRSGRTARAGKKGESFVILSHSEEKKLKYLAKNLKIEFEKVEVPSLDHVRGLKLERWAKAIAETEVKGLELSEAEMDNVFMQFKGISKEQLIQKLLTKELGNKRFKGRDELADTSDDKGKKKHRPLRDGYVVYGMNVGREDEVTKRDLVDFVASEARIDKRDIGDVVVTRRKLTFELHGNAESAVAKSFKNLSVNGRALKVYKADEMLAEESRGFKGGRDKFDKGGGRGKGDYKGYKGNKGGKGKKGGKSKKY